jgi:SAM-dependent methyltransferase
VTAAVRDMWAGAAAYDAYVGRWSRPVAAELVRWLGVPSGLSWLDVGCGPGALAATVRELAAPSAIAGVDRSGPFVAAAAAGGLTGVVADARALPLADACVDVVVSGLAVNFVPRPASAVAELSRVVVPGGVVAAYVWDYAEGMAMLRHFWDGAVALDPGAAELDEGERFAVCRPGPLERLWRLGGLTGVEVRPIDVPTVFADFDDYWEPFLGGQGPAPGYVSALPDDRRADLRSFLAARLPRAADGRIELTARAWAVRGTRPH